MKIAFMGSRGIPALYGGFETATEEIGAGLVERGHEVTVYCRYGNGDAEESSYRGMRKIYLPCLKKKSLETLSHTTLVLLHAMVQRYDVLIIMNPANGPLCIIPRLTGTPFALHVDGLDWQRSRWPWIGQRYIRFGAWCATKLAPTLIADSQGITDFYQATWNRDTVYASYGAEMEPNTDIACLEAYGLSSRGYCLVVARLEPENHTDAIVRAYESLDTDVPLVIVGDTNYDSTYIRALKESASASTLFLGGIYDAHVLHSLLHHSLLYIHGHSVGGTNPILLQAMACSCAIGYLDVSFNTEVMGECGQSFSIEDDSLVTTLCDALTRPVWLDECRIAVRERVEKQYTWEQATEAYEKICRNLMP